MLPADDKLPNRYTIEATDWHDARLDISSNGVYLSLVSGAGWEYRYGTIAWDEWDRITAWVDWRRKELGRAQQQSRSGRPVP